MIIKETSDFTFSKFLGTHHFHCVSIELLKRSRMFAGEINHVWLHLFTAACVASSWYSLVQPWHTFFFQNSTPAAGGMTRWIEKSITFCILKDISFNNIIVRKHRADVLNEIASQCLCSVFQAQGRFFQA